jgi:hypothetical protein
MEDAMSIDLDALNDIMKMLPDTPETSEKRKNALTRDDVMIIAKVVQAMGHKTCAMGFEPEEIDKLKTILNIVNRGILGIGWLIVATVTVACLTGIGWAMKHGIVEVVETAKKGAGK